MSKPGDWTCDHCRFTNFAARKECNKCSRAKPVTKQAHKPGDWKCASCAELNFASRTQCRKCNANKAAPAPSDGTVQNNYVGFFHKAVDALFGAPSASTQATGTGDRKPGDWDCAKCQTLNFGSRSVCRNCGLARPAPLSTPPDWTAQVADCELFPVDPSSQLFFEISTKFFASMPRSTKLLSILRVQNRWLWRKFESERQSVVEKNNGNPNVTMQLFHGTSASDPTLIYNGEEGFDMRFSRSGFWGQGLYFAGNSSFSNNYRYNSTIGFKNVHQIFLATVIVGSTSKCAGDSSLRLPPVKPEATSTKGFAAERFDSVTGAIGDSPIYVVYANSKAYPSYIITYSTD